MGLVLLFVLVYLASGAISLWSARQLIEFLNDTDGISDEMVLERFKALARLEMYLALKVIVLLVVGVVSGIVLITRYGSLGLVLVLVLNAVILGLGALHKRIETRARSLPTGSESLEREYRRVCDSWVKKALPDF